MATPITLYFDLVSPYAWLALQRSSRSWRNASRPLRIAWR